MNFQSAIGIRDTRALWIRQLLMLLNSLSLSGTCRFPSTGYVPPKKGGRRLVPAYQGPWHAKPMCKLSKLGITSRSWANLAAKSLCPDFCPEKGRFYHFFFFFFFLTSFLSQKWSRYQHPYRLLKTKPATGSVHWHLPLSIPHTSIDNASCSKGSSHPGKTCPSFCRLLHPTRNADMSEMYCPILADYQPFFRKHIDNKQLRFELIFQLPQDRD